MDWATDHLITEVVTIDVKADVDYYHLKEAVTNPASLAHASWYEFLLAIFAECDGRSTGVLTFAEFDVPPFCRVLQKPLALSAWLILRPARRSARSYSTAWRTSKWEV